MLQGAFATTCCRDKKLVECTLQQRVAGSWGHVAGAKLQNENENELRVRVLRICRSDMSLRVNWYFFTRAITIWGIFCPCRMSHKVQLVELPWNFVCTVMQHVPDTESNLKPIGDNNQNSLCSCTWKNKMAATSSGVRAALWLEWFFLLFHVSQYRTP